MRRLLIISPHFPPVNAPDMQRVRMMLPSLRGLGWEPTVLAVAPESVEGATIEPLLEQTYPSEIRIVRVAGISARWTRSLGFGSLWWRCGRAIKRAGEALLREGNFNLIFFSTTQFDAFSLGPVWARKFRVPYVLDYQDPWVNDYYQRSGTKPPGGKLKFALSQWMAKQSEPRVIQQASGIVAVSENYLADFSRRYPRASSSNWQQVVFGSSTADFEIVSNYLPVSPLVDFENDLIHFVYAGRCGPDMSKALTALFTAFKKLLQSDSTQASRMRFHFIGTDYAPPPLGREWVMPIVRSMDLEKYVAEHCYRVAYFDALHYLRRADALLAIGSDDASYSASKLYPYLLARRPLLMILHQQSPAMAVAQQMGVRSIHGFTEKTGIEALSTQITEHWFKAEGYTAMPNYREENLATILAPYLTRRLADVFEKACINRDD